MYNLNYAGNIDYTYRRNHSFESSCNAYGLAGYDILFQCAVLLFGAYEYTGLKVKTFTKRIIKRRYVRMCLPGILRRASQALPVFWETSWPQSSTCI